MVCIVLVVVITFKICEGIKDTSISIVTNEKIDCTPNIVDRMRAIGQWEFLAVSDEELIDTVRKGFFSDDELVRIYYGKLRLGIDLSTCSEDWISQTDDTVFVTMPPKFYNHILAAQYLEQILGCNVDLIQDHKNLRPFFRQQIERDGIDIFTAA
jgi:hypothetical protein